MAFAAARPESDTMADMNITPLVDVMLVLLIIFMVTAPLMDLRLPMTLPGPAIDTPPPPEQRLLQVEPGDLFRLDGAPITPQALESALADWRNAQPGGVLKLDVAPEADYQSAATAMATARRAGIEHIGLVEP
jgi:biopolymer transport protein ExbD